MLFRIRQIRAGSFENRVCYALGDEVQMRESEFEKKFLNKGEKIVS